MKFAHDIDMEGNEIKNAANLVTNVAAGTNANQIAVTKNGTTSTLTINNVANATDATNAENATKATQDASGNVITTTYATKAELSVIPKFAISVVTELPTTNISTTTLYLLNTGSETDNIFTEYIYVNNAWEKLGTQKLDLSGYVQKTQTVNGKALNGNISLTASDVGAAASSHNHTSANVTALTGYTIASAAAAITATDSLNIALGKLQKSIDGKQAAGSYLTSLSAGTGISVSGNTITNSGVRSVTTGGTNGTIKVNTNGTESEVAVKGLGTAAYTASTAYAAANHTHTASAVGATKKYSATNAALTVSSGVCTWSVTHNLATQDIAVALYEVSSKTQVFADVTITSDNAVSIAIKSSANIAAGTYKVVVIGG